MKSVVVLGNKTRNKVTLNLPALALAFVLGVLVVSTCGCTSWAAPGETAAESQRRQKRILRANSQAMVSDVEAVLMLDRPSKLTDRRLP